MAAVFGLTTFFGLVAAFVGCILLIPADTRRKGKIVTVLGLIVAFASLISFLSSTEGPGGPKVEEAQCRLDINCFAKKNDLAAHQACRLPIERLATLDSKWDGGIAGMFSSVRWGDREKGIIVYSGDRVQFQNSLGNWIRHHYLCEFDASNKSVASVEASPGALR
jgi:hypothetical protein